MTTKVSFANNTYNAYINGHEPPTKEQLNCRMTTNSKGVQVEVCDRWPSEPMTTGPGKIGLPLRTPFLATGDSQSHPILRGVKVMKRLLCMKLGPPDPDNLVEAPEVDTLEYMKSHSTRERVSTKTAATNCNSCHKIINPLGFALEGFDSVGRFRTEERVYSPLYQNGGTVFATHPLNTQVNDADFGDGVMRTVSNPEDLMKQLSQHPRALSCMSEYLQGFYELEPVSRLNSCATPALKFIAQKPGSGVASSIKSLVLQPYLFYRRVD